MREHPTPGDGWLALHVGPNDSVVVYVDDPKRHAPILRITSPQGTLPLAFRAPPEIKFVREKIRIKSDWRPFLEKHLTLSLSAALPLEISLPEAGRFSVRVSRSRNQSGRQVCLEFGEQPGSTDCQHCANL